MAAANDLEATMAEPAKLQQQRTTRIRALNDSLRTSLTGGKVVLTRGVFSLEPEIQTEVLEAVRRYNEFRPENDPYGEHDFGALQVRGNQIFFKIDYYDLDLEGHSDDAADDKRTCRVMTLMLAEEY